MQHYQMRYDQNCEPGLPIGGSGSRGGVAIVPASSITPTNEPTGGASLYRCLSNKYMKSVNGNRHQNGLKLLHLNKGNGLLENKIHDI